MFGFGEYIRKKRLDAVIARPVDLPRLLPDDAASCPLPMREIQEYLELEDGDAGAVVDRPLVFIRTAQIGKYRYWIWEYRTQDGEHNYVTVSADSCDVTCVSVRGGRKELSPEQIIVADARGLI